MLDVSPAVAAAAGVFPPPPSQHDRAPNTASSSSSSTLTAAARPHDAPAEVDDDDDSLGSLGTAIDVHEALRQFTSSTPAAALEPAAAATCASTFPLPPLTSSFSTVPMRTSSSPACSAYQTFRQLESRLIAKQMAKQAGVAASGKDCWFILNASWHRTWSSYVLGAAASSPPPPLSNTTLRDPRTQRVRQGLVADMDYIAVPPVVWFIFALLYGTVDDEDEKEGEKETTMTTTPSRVICRFHTNVYGAEVPPSLVKEISLRVQQQAHVAVGRLMRRQHQALLRLGGGGGAGGSSSEGGVLLPAGEFAAATGTRTNSIVTESSCCSSSASLCQARKDRRGGGGDESYLPAMHRKTPPLRFGVSRARLGSSRGGSNDGGEDMESEKSGGPWCLRRLYGCCFLLLPSSFLNFAREKLAPSSSSSSVPPPPHGQEHAEGAEDRDEARDDDIHSIISSSFSLRSLMEDDEEEGEDHDLLLLWRNRRRL